MVFAKSPANTYAKASAFRRRLNALVTCSGVSASIAIDLSRIGECPPDVGLLRERAQSVVAPVANGGTDRIPEPLEAGGVGVDRARSTADDADAAAHATSE